MGTLLLWAGCFLSVMLVTLILMCFFPEGYLQVSSSINSVFSTVPAPLRFFIIAVMPAVCEEAMHRGFIQYSFQSIRRDWVIILCMGLIFGLFHMDPYRFLPTALLGIGYPMSCRRLTIFYCRPCFILPIIFCRSCPRLAPRQRPQNSLPR